MNGINFLIIIAICFFLFILYIKSNPNLIFKLYKIQEWAQGKIKELKLEENRIKKCNYSFLKKYYLLVKLHIFG